MKKTRNVTLSIPDEVMRKLKIVAATRVTSVSAMLTEALEKIIDDEEGYGDAKRKMMADLKRGYDLGTHGKIDWKRDDLHVR